MNAVFIPAPKGLWDCTVGFLERSSGILECGLATLARGMVGRSAAAGTANTSFFLPGMVDGRALGYAVIVAFPDDVGVGREGEDALDGLASNNGHMSTGGKPRTAGNEKSTYRILMFLPPSILVQTLNTSSPLRTLSTAPQTSSPASAN